MVASQMKEWLWDTWCLTMIYHISLCLTCAGDIWIRIQHHWAKLFKVPSYDLHSLFCSIHFGSTWHVQVSLCRFRLHVFTFKAERKRKAERFRKREGWMGGRDIEGKRERTDKRDRRDRERKREIEREREREREDSLFKRDAAAMKKSMPKEVPNMHLQAWEGEWSL